MKRILMAIVAVLALATANITMAEDVYYWFLLEQLETNNN